MSKFKKFERLLDRRLLTAVSKDMREQRATSGYEEELQRQRKPPDGLLTPEMKLHGSDVQLVIVKKEELLIEQERSPYSDQDENESIIIKEEEEELWIDQGSAQLQGSEEAETNVLSNSVHMKSEDDEETPQSSLPLKRLTKRKETAAGGEDQREPAGSSDREKNVQPEIEVQIEASSDTGSATDDEADSGSGSDDEADDWTQTKDCLKKLKPAINKKAETGRSNNGPESGKSNRVVSSTEKRPFSCSECGKSFTLKTDLGRHMFLHTKEKPFSCSECGKGFVRKEHLMAHMFVHAQKKPFSCSICGKGFNRKDNLIAHKEVHSEEKRYCCSECGRGFNRKDHLTAHMFVHTREKPFSCPVCGKGFNRKDNLAAHKEVHSEEKRYRCPECGKGFHRKDLLTGHIIAHTKADLSAALYVGKDSNVQEI